MSLQMGFGVSKAQARPSVSSFLLPDDPDVQLSAMSPNTLSFTFAFNCLLLRPSLPGLVLSSLVKGEGNEDELITLTWLPHFN